MRSLVLASVVLSMTGCSIFMRSIEKPSAKVRDVSVSSAGFTGVKGELALDVTNPNPIGVPLQGIDWTLSIGGTQAVSGTVQLSQTIPAKGVAPVNTSLTIDAANAVIVGRAIAGGARDYKLHAHITFSTAVGPLSVDVDSAGQLGGGGTLEKASRLLGSR